MYQDSPLEKDPNEDPALKFPQHLMRRDLLAGLLDERAIQGFHAEAVRGTPPECGEGRPNEETV